jgi:hypothetical protein
MAASVINAAQPKQEPQELYMLSKRDEVEKDRLILWSIFVIIQSLILTDLTSKAISSNLLEAVSWIQAFLRTMSPELRMLPLVLGMVIAVRSLRFYLLILIRVWLREVTAELAEAGHNSPPQTVGFDISSDQFPRNQKPENKFVVWDATTSFPTEYHGSFDVVHVRLLTVAVTVEQIKLIAKNLVELLSKHSSTL